MRSCQTVAEQLVESPIYSCHRTLRANLLRASPVNFWLNFALKRTIFVVSDRPGKSSAEIPEVGSYMDCLLISANPG